MNNISTIEIDMDKACAQCGHMGTTSRGLCLACTGKAVREALRLAMEQREYRITTIPITGGGNMRIGMGILQVAANQVFDMIVDTETMEKMNEALLYAEEEKLSATVKIDFVPDGQGGIEIKSALSFWVQKYKKELKGRANEKQLSLLRKKEEQAQEPAADEAH